MNESLSDDVSSTPSDLDPQGECDVTVYQIIVRCVYCRTRIDVSVLT